MSPRSSHTHTTAPQGNRTNAKHSRAPLKSNILRVNQSCGKRVPAPPGQNYFLKFPPLLKIFKTAITQTAKNHANSGVTMTVHRMYIPEHSDPLFRDITHPVPAC